MLMLLNLTKTDLSYMIGDKRSPLEIKEGGNKDEGNNKV